MTELDYRHCSLDDVPNEIFAYERTLETLRLDCNNIRDLPRYLSSPNLSESKYIGCRPLFHCQELQHLNLADNELGTIPPAISTLSFLTSLDVSKNVLTDLPETIKQCKHLAVIQVIKQYNIYRVTQQNCTTTSCEKNISCFHHPGF